MEITKEFKKQVEELKKELGVSVIKETELFRKLQDPNISTWDTKGLLQFKLGQAYDYSFFSGAESTQNFKVIYRSDKITAIKKFLK